MINQDTTLEEILKQPKAEEILAKYKLPCLFCPMATYEIKNLKLGEVAKMYGLDLKNLLKELNEIKIKHKLYETEYIKRNK